MDRATKEMKRMNQKNMLITHAYYLMSEGIILYLVALPISFYYFNAVSWWHYFAIIVGISAVYSIFAKFTKSYVPYILLIPVATSLFYGLGYPILLSLAFSGVLAWRYIIIRTRLFFNSETTYLSMAIFLTLLGILIVRDIQLVVLPLVQIMINMLGYTISNLVEIKPEERKSFNRTMWLKWIGSFTMLTVIVYFLRNPLTSAANWFWDLFGGSLSFLVTAIVKLFDFLHINQFVNQHSNTEMQDIEISNAEEPYELPSGNPSGGNLDIFMAIIIGALIILFIVAILRAMKVKVREKDQNETAIFTKIEEGLNLEERRMKRSFIQKRVKIDYPVRKLMYQFERKAAKLEMGRLYYETIEDWFNRLGIEENIEIYQKVRYGEKEVSAKEHEEIKIILKKLEDKLSALRESY
jgi:hypothetical protein